MGIIMEGPKDITENLGDLERIASGMETIGNLKNYRWAVGRLYKYTKDRYLEYPP